MTTNEEAWDAGFTACAQEHTKQRNDPTYPITRVNPYKVLELEVREDGSYYAPTAGIYRIPLGKS
jgi:hypothetical protein